MVDEALARAVPVIVSTLGALAERTGGGGLALAPVLADLRAAIGGAAATIEVAAATYRAPRGGSGSPAVPVRGTMNANDFA